MKKSRRCGSLRFRNSQGVRPGQSGSRLSILVQKSNPRNADEHKTVYRKQCNFTCNAKSDTQKHSASTLVPTTTLQKSAAPLLWTNTSTRNHVLFAYELEKSAKLINLILKTVYASVRKAPSTKAKAYQKCPSSQRMPSWGSCVPSHTCVAHHPQNSPST